MLASHDSRIPLLVVFFALLPRVAAGQAAGETVIVREPVAENLYVAGGTVRVESEVEKDLVAAGGTVTVDRLVKGDATLAAGAVAVRGAVLDDVRAAGGTVTIDGAVGGDLVAAGGTVELTPRAAVRGRTWLAGGTVRVDRAHVLGDLKVGAATAVIGGRVDGTVRVAAGDISVGPGAEIRGDLVYTSPHPPRVDPAAKILGAVTMRRSPPLESARHVARVLTVLLRSVLFLGAAVTGIVVYLLFPRFTVGAAGTIGREPWRSAAVGLLVLVATPVAAFILILTLVGIPLGLALGALYGLALLLGYIVAAFWLGDLGARRLAAGREPSRGARVTGLVGAFLALALLHLLPVVGGLAGFLAVIVGLGAVALQALRAGRTGVDYAA
jgi:cytoskeletal protein CcmA (bactofilin family)